MPDPLLKMCPRYDRRCLCPNACQTGCASSDYANLRDAPAPKARSAPKPFVTSDSRGRKDVPLGTFLRTYFPDAFVELARLSKATNEKHNPGEPMHWAREKSPDHLDCLMRHLMDLGVWDDDGFLHEAKVAWRALAMLQLALEKLK